MICIHEQQRKVHVATEAASVLVALPFFVYAATRLPDPRARAVAWGLAIGSAAVDGWLLWRFVSERTRDPVFSNPSA